MARLGFREAAPIQAAAWPPACAGRDVQGLAEPGSGKTLAYLLPALAHVAGSAGSSNGGGGAAAAAAGGAAVARPRALVLAPSRELATQVSRQAAALFGVSGVAVGCVTGGAERAAQLAALAARPPGLLVATPGRLLDLADAGAVDLASVELLVLDEADKMLDVGFGPQLARLRALLLGGGGGGSADAAAGQAAQQQQQGGKGKKRKKPGQQQQEGAGAAGAAASGGRRRLQVLLFTATMPRALADTAAAWLGGGSSGGAPAARLEVRPGPESISKSITQVVQVCAEHKKPAKLLKHLAAIKEASAGLRNPPRVLVFANRIKVRVRQRGSVHTLPRVCSSCRCWAGLCCGAASTPECTAQHTAAP